jgi:ABC-type branched-subunit amino acid transport system ATPase component
VRSNPLPIVLNGRFLSCFLGMHRIGCSKTEGALEWKASKMTFLDSHSKRAFPFRHNVGSARSFQLTQVFPGLPSSNTFATMQTKTKSASMHTSTTKSKPSRPSQTSSPPCCCNFFDMDRVFRTRSRPHMTTTKQHGSRRRIPFIWRCSSLRSRCT